MSYKTCNRDKQHYTKTRYYFTIHNRMKKILLLVCVTISLFIIWCSNSSKDIVEQADSNDEDGQTFDVYFYIPEDNGENGIAIGCNDSLSPMQNTVYTNDDPLWSAIHALLTVEQDMVQAFGLETALADSTLEIDYIEDKNTYTVIALTGIVDLEEECDKLRFENQLLYTARQFFPNNNFIIVINDTTLSEFINNM